MFPLLVDRPHLRSHKLELGSFLRTAYSAAAACHRRSFPSHADSLLPVGLKLETSGLPRWTSKVPSWWCCLAPEPSSLSLPARGTSHTVLVQCFTPAAIHPIHTLAAYQRYTTSIYEAHT